jgi:hypothetical protein
MEKLDEIMENLDLGEASGYSGKESGKNLGNNHLPAEDFLVCCNSNSDKSQIHRN